MDSKSSNTKIWYSSINWLLISCSRIGFTCYGAIEIIVVLLLSRFLFQFLPPPRRLCFHHRRQLVCSLARLCETTQPICTKFGEKVAHGPRKKPLDFGGNPDSVTLELRLRLGTPSHFAWESVLLDVCWINLRYQRPWRRNALDWMPF